MYLLKLKTFLNEGSADTFRRIVCFEHTIVRLLYRLVGLEKSYTVGVVRETNLEFDWAVLDPCKGVGEDVFE